MAQDSGWGDLRLAEDGIQGGRELRISECEVAATRLVRLNSGSYVTGVGLSAENDDAVANAERNVVEVVQATHEVVRVAAILVSAVEQVRHAGVLARHEDAARCRGWRHRLLPVSVPVRIGQRVVDRVRRGA